MKKKLYLFLFIPFILGGIGLLSSLGLLLDIPQNKQLIIGSLIGLVMWFIESNTLHILIQKWINENNEKVHKQE